VLQVRIPPLRERVQDIEYLARRFLAKGAGHDVAIADSALRTLREHAFDGNIRELRNLMEGALALGDGQRVTLADLPALRRNQGTSTKASGRLDAHLNDVERDDIVTALAACGGNQSAAARRLGVSRRALIYRMEKHGLKPKPASS